MAHIAVRNGKPKWVHLKWLSHCDPASLLCKKHDSWVRQYKQRSTLQPVPKSSSESSGDQSFERREGEVDGDVSSLPLRHEIPAECTKFDEELSEYMDAASTGEDAE